MLWTNVGLRCTVGCCGCIVSTRDKVALISSTKLDVIATGVATGIGGQQGVHHCTQVDIGWYRVQLVEIMEGFGSTPLLITNDNDDPPQL
jgi:hypothetical protein